MEFGCSTCLETFTSKCVVSTTPCGHVFHRECITNWLQNENSCPQCRKACTSDQIIKTFFSGLHNKLKHERAEKEAMLQWMCNNNPKAEDGTTALHHAAKNGQVEVCQIMLSQTVDKNPKDVST